MSDDLHWELKGIGDWELDIDRFRHYMDAATKQGVNRGLFLAQQDIQASLSEKTHPPGTKTPSEPGEPPALVTGALRRSITVESAKGGGGVYAGRVGPKIVYGRIHELGGNAGKDHRAHLPPRPYVKPSFISIQGPMARAIKDLWRKVWSGNAASHLSGDI